MSTSLKRAGVILALLLASTSVGMGIEATAPARPVIQSPHLLVADDDRNWCGRVFQGQQRYRDDDDDCRERGDRRYRDDDDDDRWDDDDDRWDDDDDDDDDDRWDD